MSKKFLTIFALVALLVAAMAGSAFAVAEDFPEFTAAVDTSGGDGSHEVSIGDITTTLADGLVVDFQVYAADDLSTPIGAKKDFTVGGGSGLITGDTVGTTYTLTPNTAYVVAAQNTGADGDVTAAYNLPAYSEPFYVGPRFVAGAVTPAIVPSDNQKFDVTFTALIDNKGPVTFTDQADEFLTVEIWDTAATPAKKADAKFEKATNADGTGTVPFDFTVAGATPLPIGKYTAKFSGATAIATFVFPTDGLPFEVKVPVEPKVTISDIKYVSGDVPTVSFDVAFTGDGSADLVGETVLVYVTSSDHKTLVSPDKEPGHKLTLLASTEAARVNYKFVLSEDLIEGATYSVVVSKDTGTAKAAAFDPFKLPVSKDFDASDKQNDETAATLKATPDGVVVYTVGETVSLDVAVEVVTEIKDLKLTSIDVVGSFSTAAGSKDFTVARVGTTNNFTVKGDAENAGTLTVAITGLLSNGAKKTATFTVTVNADPFNEDGMPVDPNVASWEFENEAKTRVKYTAVYKNKTSDDMTGYIEFHESLLQSGTRGAGEGVWTEKSDEFEDLAVDATTSWTFTNIPKGTYQYTVYKKLADGTYERVATSDVIDIFSDIAEEPHDSSSGVGCDAGFGAFALLGLAGMAAILRKKD